MLGIVGVLQLMEGIAAVAKDTIYVTGIAYVYEFNVTTWGWIHIVVGALAVAAAVGVFMDQAWARVVGIVLAVLGAVVNFAFMPYYPVWSVVMITISGFIIWALCVVQRDTLFTMSDERPMSDDRQSHRMSSPPHGPASAQRSQGAAAVRDSGAAGAEPVSRNSRIAKPTSTMTVVHTTTIVVG
jgi:hypothetical protein